MSKINLLIASIFLALSCQATMADDWTGQPTTSSASGVLGPYSNDPLRGGQFSTRCEPALTPPPCTPGQTPIYFLEPGAESPLSSIPAAAAASNNIGVSISGAYTDASSPTGLSEIEGTIPLSAFARSSTVDGLSTQVGNLSSALGSLTTSFNALSATVGNLSAQMQLFAGQLNQLQQQLQTQNRSLRQGVAMSLAMDGVGDLGPDEKVAVSMNFGTFGGQNGLAAGVAFRVADHLSFNGGFGTGVNGGLAGGRVGVRFAW